MHKYARIVILDSFVPNDISLQMYATYNSITPFLLHWNSIKVDKN